MENGSKRLARIAAAGVMTGSLFGGLLVFASPADAARDVSSACTSAIPEDNFTDTGDAGSPIESAVDCIVAYDLTAGKTATTYDPSGTVSRAQMASFAMNVLDAVGVARPANAPNAFTDDEGIVHEDNINDAAALGIVQGTGGGLYNPSGEVSRAQMATFLVNTMDAAGVTVPTPPATTAFTDIAGNPHETNIKIISDDAGWDLADGTTATTYSPSNSMSRGQMAFFLSRGADLLVDEGLLTPFGAPAGIVTDVNIAGDAYQFSNGSALVDVTYDATNDVFTVDGAPASMAAFEAAITVGDEITFIDDPSTTTAADADRHELTNVAPASRRSGVIGNINTLLDAFSIIEPVSGVVISDVKTYTGDVLNVDGAVAPVATFEGALNEGDTVVITVDAAANESYAITNQTVTGPVTSANIVTHMVTIGALGDDPLTAQDATYDYVAGSTTNTYTVGGTAATQAQFEAALTVGDTLAHARSGDTATWALTNVAPPTVSGVNTDATVTAGAGGTLELVNGATDITSAYTATASFRLGGVTVTEAELEAALTPGDQVSHTPDNPDTAGNEEVVSVTNANLTGVPTNIDTTANTYDVVNAQGNLIASITYGGAGDRYFRNGTEVSLANFDTLMDKVAADTTPDDTIEVVFGALATEHRLTTDETL